VPLVNDIDADFSGEFAGGRMYLRTTGHAPKQTHPDGRLTNPREIIGARWC